ncbi:hypothetical protein N9W21_09365, partial [Shewanella sp.]|nr:hypothetical protein [Shewanella sp.]
LAEYWVVKNSLIDWQTLFAKHRQDNPDSSPTLYKASFVIRSNGKVEQFKILNSVTGQYSDLAKDIDTQLLEFYPTVKNIAKQPVMLNTSFRI